MRMVLAAVAVAGCGGEPAAEECVPSEHVACECPDIDQNYEDCDPRPEWVRVLGCDAPYGCDDTTDHSGTCLAGWCDRDEGVLNGGPTWQYFCTESTNYNVWRASCAFQDFDDEYGDYDHYGIDYEVWLDTSDAANR